MRQKKFFILMILFAIFFAYITNIEQIPKNITLFQNEKYQIEYLRGIEIDGENIEEKENFLNKLITVNTDIIGDIELKLSALGGFFNKTITVSVVPEVQVIPGGDCIGVKVYSKGVLIVGESKVQLEDGSWSTPYEAGTFKTGDLLLKIDDYEIEEAEEISKIINNIGSKKVILTCQRDGKIFNAEVTPLKCLEDGKYKIGLWVRDGAMGVGTLTFYSPDYSSYAALGHGISDEDSKSLIELGTGEIYGANVFSVTKGRSESPGEIRGILVEEDKKGTIEKNSNAGIIGSLDVLSTEMSTREKISVASKNEVKVGPAKIRCTIDNSQEIKEYDVEIQKVSSSNFFETKGMIIKVTDEELISKTGGIIQGMSGSPIIQNGKLVGAVTHVYVNDPTKGYGIFAETMIEKMNEKWTNLSEKIRSFNITIYNKTYRFPKNKKNWLLGNWIL